MNKSAPADICGIPIAPVLIQIYQNRILWENTDCKEGAYWGTWFDTKCENTVLNVMPAGTSERRARAFMKVASRKLGLVTGCHCGCRGDYELTPLGDQLDAAAIGDGDFS